MRPEYPTETEDRKHITEAVSGNGERKDASAEEVEELLEEINV